MTIRTERPAAPPRHVESPRLRGSRLHCPRCEGRLMFDGDEYVCVVCGYEFPAEELSRDVQRALRRGARPHEMVMAIGAAIAVGGLIGRSLAGLALLGAAGGAALGVALVVAASVTRRRAS